jgi:Cupin
LRIEAAEPIELAAGDLVVLPRGAPHVMGPSPECAVMSLERFLASHNGVFTQADVATTLAAAALGSRREGLKRPLSARRVVTAIGVGAPSIKQAGCDMA